VAPHYSAGRAYSSGWYALVIGYQSTIGERYGKEIERLDAELVAARMVEKELRERIEALEDSQHELRYLRRAARHAGVFNPWEHEAADG